MSATSSSNVQSRPQNKRKGSLGKILGQFFSSFTRRDSATSFDGSDESFSVVERPASSCGIISDTPSVILEPTCGLVVDDIENIPGTIPEPNVPLHSLERESCGIADVQTRQLFESHGLAYQTRRPAGAAPPVKMRRVDKRPRMRVRWTCHDCSTVFGAGEHCPSCDHRRCHDCIRDPPRRPKPPQPVLDHTHVEQARNEADTQRTPIIEPESSVNADDEAPWNCTIHVGRPRPQQETFISHGEEQRSAAPIVDRVYRKPRQRVRYLCEHCHLQFPSTFECSGCGHERCKTCPRYPPRKRKATHDTTAWLALQAKIDDTFHAPPEYATEIAAHPPSSQLDTPNGH